MLRCLVLVPFWLMGAAVFATTTTTTTTTTRQVRLGTIVIPAEVKIGPHVVPLRGGTTLRFFGLQIYYVALYQDPSVPVTDLFATTRPLQLMIHYLRPVTRQQFIDTTRNHIEDNPAHDLTKLRKRLDYLYSKYSNVQRGDVYILQWRIGEGTTITLNNANAVNIPGDDFARAFLGIWLGPGRENQDFKRRLLRWTEIAQF